MTDSDKLNLNQWIQDTALPSANDNELEPWIAFDGDSACTWRIVHLNGDALALFSTEQMARDYALKVHADRVEQLKGTQLLSVLISAFKANLEFLALDPSEAECRKIFQLRDVLRSAKQQFGH